MSVSWGKRGNDAIDTERTWIASDMASAFEPKRREIGEGRLPRRAKFLGNGSIDLACGKTEFLRQMEQRVEALSSLSWERLMAASAGDPDFEPIIIDGTIIRTHY
jgi:hypothetical protein